MFGFKSGPRRERGRFDSSNIERKMKKGVFDSLRHAAFSLAKLARSKIKPSDEASKPGEPATTRGGRRSYRAAIWTDVQQFSAVIGPRHSIVGDVGKQVEHGKDRGKGDSSYEARPVMGPTLEESLSRFPRRFSGSIGE